MQKRIICLTVIICIIFTALFTTIVNASGYDAAVVSQILKQTDVNNLKAKASVLLDVKTGRILLEKNSHEKRSIASVTKVMTLLLIMEAIDSGKIKLTDMVTASQHAYTVGGSTVFLEPGETFSVNDMLKGIAVPSANDASVAMAEKIAGSESVFVSMMNEKAKALGMKDTHFLDSTGLSGEGHYSSAHDVAIMARELINKHPDITKYTTIWHEKFADGITDLYNTNALIYHYNGCVGLKTGYTSAAGHNLVAVAKRGDLGFMSVVLGEADSNTRFAESMKLLDYGFANYEFSKINKKNDIYKKLTVKKGVKTEVNAVYKNDIEVLLNKSKKEKVTREPVIKGDLTAPVKKGQKLGQVIFKIDGKEVARTDIVADKEVKKASFIRLFFRMILSWFGID